MMRTTKTRLSAMAVALAALTVACTDPTMPDRTLVTDGASRTVTHELYVFPSPGFPTGILPGEIELCKSVPEDDPGGTFDFTVTTNGTGSLPDATPTITVGPGGTECITAYVSHVFNSAVEQVVITENTPPTNWTLVDIDTRQLLAEGIFNAGGYTSPRLSDAENVGTRTATLFINNDMARVVTFTNDFEGAPPPPPPPPPEECDFITFGRLVTTIDGQKVVISGNAGGNQPGGGILGEFHVEVNGVDNHVAVISTYGPITSGALSGLTNSRVVTGTAKNGNTVELRLWDGGEPGKGTDLVWVSINGTVVTAAGGQLIDQGNMQFHDNCRGPGGD
jgi:hypothetical protein